VNTRISEREVRDKAEELKIKRRVICGAVIQQIAVGYTLDRPGGETLTTLNMALSTVTNITLASVIESLAFDRQS
jgi:hypothetical protein